MTQKKHPSNITTDETG